MGAVPHWGQLHAPTADLGALFGEKLAIWQWAMNLIATAGIGTPDLFWTEFARERGLLNFSPGVRLHPAVLPFITAGSIAGLFAGP